MAFDLIRRVQSLGHPRLLVVGDLILDRYIWGDAERISQEAPVPLLRADTREHRLGGAASVATMLATLQALGVMPSLSRPGVSNDNPYSESLFKTLKYRPAYPLKAFDTLLAARTWVGALVRWYNHEHRHSAIRFVTPAQRHANLDHDILDRRAALYRGRCFP